MDKLAFMRLWDAYSPLLTDTQREITDYYLNLDLSLAEIAEQKGISRQAVSDCLSKCRRELAELEQKLHFVTMTAEADLRESRRLTELSRALIALQQAHPERADELTPVLSLIDKDYTEEVRNLLPVFEED